MVNTTQDEFTLEAIPFYTTIIYTLFGIIGIIGNGLVLLVIALVDDLRGVTNLFIANQSLIDLSSSVVLIASFVVPLPPLPSGRLTLADFLCRFWYTKYLFWSLITASSTNLTIMTIERYYAIFYPIKYRSQTNSKGIKLIAIIPYVFGALCQLNLFFYAGVEENQCILYLFSNIDLGSVVFFSALIVLLFIIPVIVMICVYFSIWMKLRKDALEKFDASRQSSRVDKPRKGSDRPTTDYRNRARRNTIKTMLTVSIFFVLCWSLNQVLVTAGTLGGGIDFNSLLYQVSVFMGFGNMWVNPFIYTFQYRRFQKGLKKILCRKTKRPRSSDVQTTSKSLADLE